MLKYVGSGIMLIYHSFFIISREKIKTQYHERHHI